MDLGIQIGESSLNDDDTMKGFRSNSMGYMELASYGPYLDSRLGFASLLIAVM